MGAGLGLGDEQHEVELLLPPPEAEHHVRAEAEEVVHLGQRGGLATSVPAEVIVNTEDVWLQPPPLQIRHPDPVPDLDLPVDDEELLPPVVLVRDRLPLRHSPEHEQILWRKNI